MKIKAWLRRQATVMLLGPGALNLTNQHPEGMVKSFTFGNVTTKVWLNKSWRGNPYFKFTLEQLVVHKNGGRSYRKTFYREDLDDIARCVIRVKAWMTDGDGFEKKRIRR